jgi:hypothetical protein
VAVYDNEKLKGNPIATGRRDFTALATEHAVGDGAP